MEPKRANVPLKGKKEPEDSDTHPEKADNDKDGWYKKFRNRWRDMTPANRFIVPFTGIVALSTLIYSGVAIFQWRALLDSNKTNREALESVQRAYISFDQIDLDAAPVSFGSEQLQWVFSADVEDTGTTPAIDKVQYFDGSNTLSTEPTEAQFIGSHHPTIEGQIGPKAHVRFGRKITGNDFILGNFPLLSVGKPDFMKFFESRRVFFWGWVVYRDVFPQTAPHVTEFCEEVKGIMVKKTELGPRPILGVDDCTTHNCTDEHCDDYNSIAGFAPQK